MAGGGSTWDRSHSCTVTAGGNVQGKARLARRGAEHGMSSERGATLGNPSQASGLLGLSLCDYKRLIKLSELQESAIIFHLCFSWWRHV